MTSINRSYPDKFQHIYFQNILLNLAEPTIYFFVCWIASELIWVLDRIFMQNDIQRHDFGALPSCGLPRKNSKWSFIYTTRVYTLICEKSPKTAWGKYYIKQGMVLWFLRAWQIVSNFFLTAKHQRVMSPAFPGRRLSPQLQAYTEQLQKTKLNTANTVLAPVYCTISGSHLHKWGRFPCRCSCTLWPEE